MQNREILMAHNPSQSKYRVVTGAETLGELKEEIARNENVYKMVGQSWIKNDSPVDISGLTFTEGISKTQLLTDNSQLPVNVLFKGQPTNNLVMLLTNTHKNIASGADYPTDRKLFSDYIKKCGLGEAIKAKFGNNWTRVSTEKLIGFFADTAEKSKTDSKEAIEQVREELKDIDKETKCVPETKTAPHANTVEWFYDGVKKMAKDNLLYVEDIAVLSDLLTELYQRLEEEKPKITSSDIDAMLGSIV